LFRNTQTFVFEHNISKNVGANSKLQESESRHETSSVGRHPTKLVAEATI